MKSLINKKHIKLKDSSNQFIYRVIKDCLDYINLFFFSLMVYSFIKDIYIFAILFFVFLLLSIYISFARSVILITNIDVNNKYLNVFFYEFNKEKELQFILQNLKVDIYMGIKGPGRGNKLVLKDNINKIIQYEILDWSIEIMKEVKAKIEKEKQRLSEEN